MENQNAMNHRAFLLTLNFSLLFWTVGESQFQKVYKSSPYDQEGQDVVQMADGGFLIAGYSGKSTAGDIDAYIIRAEANGEQSWTKMIGGGRPDFINHILKASDGNYYLVGYSQSYGGGDEDIFIIKLDAKGDEVWHKTYGYNGNERGNDIVETSDGNFMVVGSVKAPGGNYNANLRKIDAAGTELWSKEYGGPANDFGNCVKLCTDGGFIIVGQTYSMGQGGDAYLVKTDASGTETWSKNYGGALSDEGVYVTANSNGTFTFLNRDSCTAGKDIDITIMNVDANGSVNWTKQYGSTEKDTPKMIQPTLDGGYIVCGNSRSFGWVNPDMWILKLNGNGDTTWTRHYGGKDHEHCYTIRQLNEWTYIAVGKTDSFDPDFDPIFIMLNAEGTLALDLTERRTNMFNIYPNPTNGLVTLGVNEDELSSIQVTDITGRTIYSVSGKDLSHQIDLGKEERGIYILSARTSGGAGSYKIVKQ